jgi:hypothetical protein
MIRNASTPDAPRVNRGGPESHRNARGDRLATHQEDPSSQLAPGEYYDRLEARPTVEPHGAATGEALREKAKPESK